MNYFKGIGSIKDKEKGRRGFVLANGPSINRLNLSLLKDELVIGMNASTMLEAQYDFVSKYYVVSDVRFIQHEEKCKFASELLNPLTIRVFRSEVKNAELVHSKNKTYYVNALKRDGFSENLSVGYFFGCTTTMLAIQLAYHLGVSELYLLGCDLTYPKESPRFYKETVPQLEDSFVSVQLKNISLAADVFESKGRRLFQCNKYSLLNPYVDYQDFEKIF